MQNKETLIPNGENKLANNSNEASTNQQQQKVEKETDKNLIILKGTLTSRIEVKPSSDIPAYGFFKLDNQEKEKLTEKEDKDCVISQLSIWAKSSK